MSPSLSILSHSLQFFLTSSIPENIQHRLSFSTPWSFSFISSFNNIFHQIIASQDIPYPLLQSLLNGLHETPIFIHLLQHLFIALIFFPAYSCHISPCPHQYVNMGIYPSRCGYASHYRLLNFISWCLCSVFCAGLWFVFYAYMATPNHNLSIAH